LRRSETEGIKYAQLKRLKSEELRRFVLELRACAHSRESVTDVTDARTCETDAQLRKSQIPGSEPRKAHHLLPTEMMTVLSHTNASESIGSWET
jgi:hypothetical protein